MKKKVQDIINELNRTTGHVWIAAGDVHALTTVTKDAAGAVTFNPGKGVPVKVFLNQNTGEIRLYPAMMFEDGF